MSSAMAEMALYTCHDKVDLQKLYRWNFRDS